MSEVQHDVLYTEEATVLVIADGDDRRNAAMALVRQAGARPIAPETFAEGVGALEAVNGLPPVFVDVAHDHGAAFDGLLVRLDESAALLGRPSMVSLPAALIDAAAARAPHPGVMLLPDAAAEERAMALAAALATAAEPGVGLREESAAPLQLLQLSEEVGRIARTLASLSGATDGRGGTRLVNGSGEARPPSAGTVRALIRARRLREQFFAPVLFADPAWDMMLDLYAARLEGRAVAVSSLCIAAAVPATTALRWMKQLVDDELFVRIADPRDGRRVFIELSPMAADGLAGYFEAVGRIGFAMP